MVTSPKMSENEMGDRGSKSEFLNLSCVLGKHCYGWNYQTPGTP